MFYLQNISLCLCIAHRTGILQWWRLQSRMLYIDTTRLLRIRKSAHVYSSSAHSFHRRMLPSAPIVLSVSCFGRPLTNNTLEMFNDQFDFFLEFKQFGMLQNFLHYFWNFYNYFKSSGRKQNILKCSEWLVMVLEQNYFM